MTLAVVALAALGATRQPARGVGTDSVPAPTNPVWLDDFPDPSIFRLGPVYFAYATNRTHNVEAIQSVDLRHWVQLGDVLPRLPRWAAPGRTWSPAVAQRAGTFLLYYTAQERSSGLQCISVATSRSPLGPFTDDTAGPLVCQHEDGGSIDPFPFGYLDGRVWLLWKSEGRGWSRRPPLIWSQPLRGDGRALEGRATAILVADQGWEGGVVEAPELVLVGGRHLLYYSANDWHTGRYATGYAACAGPVGPCHKPLDRPLLASTRRVAGPGGPALFADATGAPWIAYHGWDAARVGYPAGRRTLRVDRLTYGLDGMVGVAGPTADG